ncbi:histone H1 [Volvox carteri f. nagariensis]|uniref:Histone H1 n=1 Tax=Volvox carteri f. nagariensis TaxID=3068 RepID=D8TM57_VOLCA|nr:histone H1 [Volvox carteri f. nagariensis]EFJ51586.1 histone H1 [Volvox carteri f. nagariensis]|eukprot:XP_002947538.1 histone H1 [Volvox carteri f. nagariensis]
MADTAEAAAAKAPNPKKNDKPKKLRAPPTHPTYLEMITEAIAALKDRTEISDPKWPKRLAYYLKTFADQGKLEKVKASFKLSDELKKAVKAKDNKVKKLTDAAMPEGQEKAPAKPKKPVEKPEKAAAPPPKKQAKGSKPKEEASKPDKEAKKKVKKPREEKVKTNKVKAYKAKKDSPKMHKPKSDMADKPKAAKAKPTKVKLSGEAKRRSGGWKEGFSDHPQKHHLAQWPVASQRTTALLYTHFKVKDPSNICNPWVFAIFGLLPQPLQPAKKVAPGKSPTKSASPKKVSAGRKTPTAKK